MIKIISKILLSLIILLTLMIFYLSFFGISTKQLNQKIINEALKINPKINLDLKSVKLILIPFNFTINVKINDLKLLIDSNEVNLEQITTNISLKSLINNQFLIDNLIIYGKNIKLNSLISLTRTFKNSTELFILDNMIKGGLLTGDVHLNFDNEGKVKDDYEIKGFIKKGNLNILSRYFINDLNFNFNIKNKNYYLKNLEINFNKIRLSSQFIKIMEVNNKFLIKGKLQNKKRDLDLEALTSILGNNFNNQDVKSIKLSSDSDFTFFLDKKLKISDFQLKSEISLNRLIYENNNLKIKDYLPNFKKLLKLEDHKVSINYKKKELDIKGKGKIIIEDSDDTIDYRIIKKGNKYKFNTNIKINKNQLFIDAFQYKKKKNIESLLKLKGVYEKNNQIKFDLISFNENDNSILINNLSLNKEFSILDIDKIELDYVNNNEVKNQIKIKKNKKIYEIKGKNFDLTQIINKALNSDSEETLLIFNNIDPSFEIDIENTYLDKRLLTNNFKGFVDFKNNKIHKLILVSTFPNKKELNLTINTNQKNEKITTLSSEYPKPLIGKYKFIKGFEGGILDFYSIKKNNTSKSTLTIEDFKIQEVPVLAKLLTLASLQGIADLLTGEGIRFTDFEMKFSNKKSLVTIEELYAIGPAISIMMDGYIQSKKLISLRGTLVPATTINKSIASIPLIGKILVGDKTGEGVFGVSFKIKGPPNNLRTSVNPIKTLTPRFITRTLEKIKNN
tara:strand:+ start:420 stop:2621 length:2202 start_codon:yes stop_codon:yes gene_type:complete